MNVDQLFRNARIPCAGAVADEMRQSLPIPVREPDRPTVVFCFFGTLLTGTGELEIYPPQFLARFDWESGDFLELRAVRPADFEFDHAAADLLGLFAMPRGMTADVFLRDQNQLFADYDVLLPSFFHSHPDVPPTAVRAAVDFMTLFARLSEPPARPYYKAVGHEFFTFVERLAGSEPIED